MGARIRRNSSRRVFIMMVVGTAMNSRPIINPVCERGRWIFADGISSPLELVNFIWSDLMSIEKKSYWQVNSVDDLVVCFMFCAGRQDTMCFNCRAQCTFWIEVPTNTSIFVDHDSNAIVSSTFRIWNSILCRTYPIHRIIPYTKHSACCHGTD